MMGRILIEIFSLAFVTLLFIPSAYPLDLKLIPPLPNSTSKPVTAPEEKTVQTQETLVDIDGVKYREIRYQARKYYLKIGERELSFGEAFDCLTPRDENDKSLHPKYLYGELSPSRRSQEFVSRLVSNCENPPDSPQGPTAALSAPATMPVNDPRVVTRPGGKDLGISFDSEEHRGKSTTTTPGGVGGGMD